MLKHHSWQAWSLFALFFVALGKPTPAHADSEQKNFVVRTWAYEKINRAHELIGESKYDKALGIVDSLKRRPVNDHEKCLMMQARSHIFASKNQYAKAAKELEDLIKLGALPDAALLQSQYNLGQLYMALKKYKLAVRELSTWVAKVEKPSGSALYTVSAAYYQAKQPKQAVSFAQRAVSSTRKPKKSWLQLLLSLRFELKQYRQATTVLKKLIPMEPKKKGYWLQLASAFEEMKQTKRALAVMELAHRHGVLDKPSEIKNLTQRLMFEAAPAKGAKLLEKAIADKQVPKDEDSLKLLANAWTHARQRSEAVKVLEQLGDRDKTGKSDLRAAQLYVEMERWKSATGSLQKAVKKGKLDNPGQAHLLLGTVLINQKRFGEARRAFLRAKEFKQTRRTASGWLAYLEQQESL